MTSLFLSTSRRTVCILSATGAISSVTLRHATSSRPVTYQGEFEILSLSASVLAFKRYGQGRPRGGGLRVLLAGDDFRVLGGEVAGPLIALNPVQIVAGTFIPKGGGGGGPKEPPLPVIPSAGGESAPEEPAQAGMPAPSSPIPRGALSSSSSSSSSSGSSSSSSSGSSSGSSSDSSSESS